MVTDEFILELAHSLGIHSDYDGRSLAFARAIERAAAHNAGGDLPTEAIRLLDLANDYSIRLQMGEDWCRDIDALLAAHNAGAQAKGTGIRAQVISSRICSALEADKDEGYDLEAGMFGKALSSLIRELAEMTISAGAQEPDAARDAQDAKRWRWIEKKLRLGPPIGPNGAPKRRYIIVDTHLGHGPETVQKLTDVIDAEIARLERESDK